MGGALGRKDTSARCAGLLARRGTAPGRRCRRTTQGQKCCQTAAGHLGLVPGLWSPRFPAQSSETPPRRSADRSRPPTGRLLALTLPAAALLCGRDTRPGVPRHRARALAWHGNVHRAHSPHPSRCSREPAAGRALLPLRRELDLVLRRCHACRRARPVGTCCSGSPRLSCRTARERRRGCKNRESKQKKNK